MSLLALQGISKQDRGIISVEDISFSLDPFRKIAIAGETGSGKTTLLKMIAGLIQPDTGSVYFEGERVLGPTEKLIPGHAGIGYLSQHFELRNNYRVEDELDAKNKLTTEEADHIFTVCRIRHLLHRKTDQLSGGEKQRIALARVLISSPRLLLLDEPFSNLDMGHKQEIKQVVNDISAELIITCLMVLHDAPDILSWADSIFVMQDGRFIQQGSPEEIYHHPVNEYCAGLFGIYNLVSPSTEFFPIPDSTKKDQKLFLRPEHIYVTGTNDHSIDGIVKRVSFWGSYYILDLKVGDESVYVQVNHPRYSIGESVKLAVAENTRWFLNGSSTI